MLNLRQARFFVPCIMYVLSYLSMLNTYNSILYTDGNDMCLWLLIYILIRLYKFRNRSASEDRQTYGISRFSLQRVSYSNVLHTWPQSVSQAIISLYSYFREFNSKYACSIRILLELKHRVCMRSYFIGSVGLMAFNLTDYLKNCARICVYNCRKSIYI